MKKLITIFTLLTLASFNTNAFFGKKEISGEYKGKERIALEYLGASFLKGCSSYKLGNYELLALLGTGIAYSVSPITGLITLAASQGTVGVLCFDQSVTKTKNYNIRLKASVTKTSSDRISMVITSQDKKKCAGFTLKLIGEGDGFGGYDLYKNKDSYLKNEVFGNATFHGGKFDLSISEDMSMFTKGRKGYNCKWDLEHGLNVRFK